MPKAKGPLFSVSARKSLGKVLTFQGRPGGTAVYPYKKPKVPLTDKQIWQREKISILVHWWQSLSDADKAVWEAKAKGQGQSGYSYFISQQKDWMLDPSLVLYLPLWSKTLKADSITSKDSYERPLTNYGALWTPRGRYFNGTTDYMKLLNFIDFGPASSFAIECWTYPKTGGYSEQHLVDIWGCQSFKIGTSLHYKEGTTLTAVGALTLDAWNHTAILRKGNGDRELVVNGESVASFNEGSPSNPSPSIRIGDMYSGLGDLHFYGYIDEVRIYEGEPGVAGIARDYNATKWRYE